MFDSVVITEGEIICWSFLGVKGVGRHTKALYPRDLSLSLALAIREADHEKFVLRKLKSLRL